MKSRKDFRKAVCVLGMVLSMFVSSYPIKSYGYNNEIRQLAASVADTIRQSGVSRVAVADFTDLQGNITELGRFLAEHFSVALASSGRSLGVVDRTHIKTLLREHKLSATGLIDTTTAKELGKIAGVEALLKGTITPFGDTVEVTIKVLQVETAMILDARTSSLPKTQTIQELLEKGVQLIGMTSTRTSNRTTPSTQLRTQQTIESNGFTFAFQSCRGRGQNIDCHLLVTSIGQDKELRLGEDSSMFDNFGDAYYPQIMTLGDDRAKYSTASSIYSYAEKVLFADVPMKAILSFEGVSTETETIPVLAFMFESNRKRFIVKFENIALVR